MDYNAAIKRRRHLISTSRKQTPLSEKCKLSNSVKNEKKEEKYTYTHIFACMCIKYVWKDPQEAATLAPP